MAIDLDQSKQLSGWLNKYAVAFLVPNVRLVECAALLERLIQFYEEHEQMAGDLDQRK